MASSRLFLFTLLCVAGVASAQPSAPSVDALRDRYPPKSIDSVDKADAALGGTAGAKARVDREFKEAARACIGRVLVNDCLDEAREVRRKRVADIDAIELEANRFKRQDRADRLDRERAKREADRAAAAPADAVEREARRKAYEQKQADAVRNAADRAKSDATRSANPRGPAVRRPSPNDSVSAEQRTKNAADYAKKQKDAADHRVEIDRRLAQKSADRKRREEARAAKDAKLAAAAAAANAPPAKP